MALPVALFLICVALSLILLMVLSPRKERCHDCEALSLSESEALPPTPHEIEHARHQAA